MRCTAALWATRWNFIVLGFVYGSWAVRIPDVARAAHVDEARLGVVLLALAVGSLLGMPAASRVLRHVGLPALARFGTLLLAGMAVVLASSGSFATLATAATAFGFVNGGFGVVINAAAARWEHATGRRCIAGCHASFSFATLAASIGGGLAVSYLSPGMHLILAGAACVLGTLVVGGRLSTLGSGEDADSETRHAGDDARAPRIAQAPNATQAPNGTGAGHIVRLAAALAFVALFAEGIVTDWSAFFIQHAVLGHPDARQSWGYGGFALAMACGRLGGDAALERVGEGRLLALSLALAVCGYLVVVTATVVPGAVGGFVLVGVGLSNLYPAMISFIGSRMPAAGRDTAIAAVSGIGYFGFLGGPAILGLASHLLGLRLAMAAPVVALLGGALVLRSLRQHAP